MSGPSRVASRTNRLLISGGTVVTANGSRRADVAVIDGRIEAVGTDLAIDDAERIDATGMLVLPGAIDVHTHLRLPDDRRPDRFRQDLGAAARGGTTTVLTFNNPGTGISERGAGSLLDGLDEFRDRTGEPAPIDFGLNAVVSGRQPRVLEELPALIARGVPTFKAFMVYEFATPESALPGLMRTAAEHGGMLQLHCEDPAIIDPLVADAVRRGDVEPRTHARTRPTSAEATATRRAIELAREAGASLYIVHLSCREALDAVAEAKARGEPVYAETCPHYLTLTEDLYDDPDDAEVMKRVIAPPLRSAADVAALWDGVRDGVIDVIGSDHVPDRLDDEKRLPAPPFPEISNGAPGIETLLAVAYGVGVGGGRIGVERLVDVVATTPARLFGLPTKGAVESGRDADLVVWDPAVRREIRQRDLSHTSDFTPFEGLAVEGAPRVVLSHGAPIGVMPGRFLERRLGD